MMVCRGPYLVCRSEVRRRPITLLSIIAEYSSCLKTNWLGIRHMSRPVTQNMMGSPVVHS